MTEPVSVTIGKVTAELQPVGITAAVSLAVGPDDPKAEDPGYVLAVSAACLRAAWPDDVAWPARKRPRPIKLGQDAAEYGAQVLDALYPESGMTLGALAQELAKARGWVVLSAISESEVSSVADFSDGQEGTVD
tara:strand:- start:878 stop:1279 length:402 start_codon:yes stop_codon:yes gene_type:complete